MTAQYSILFIVPAKASTTITHIQDWGFSETLFQACKFENLYYEYELFLKMVCGLFRQ